MGATNEYTIYCDGSSYASDTGRHSPSGWGAVIVHNGITEEISGSISQASAVEAEVIAAIESIRHTPKDAKIQLFTDLEYMADRFLSGVAKKVPGAARKSARLDGLWAELSIVAGMRDVRIEWIKGHSGHAQHDRADRLANAAMRKLHHEIVSAPLVMHMQPIVDFSTGRIVRAEALARKFYKNGKVISPSVFLPLSDDESLCEMFKDGLSQSLKSMRDWDKKGVHVDVSVNLPCRVLVHPECATWIIDELNAKGVNPERLCIEVLEQENDDNADDIGAITMLSAITRIKDAGVALSMDDLGAGHSSLYRMIAYPFGSVKIDHGIILKAHDSGDKGVRFVHQIILMAHAINMKVVIEGLETLELVEMAACLGADYGQGYHLATPIRADNIAKVVARFGVMSIDPENPVTELGKRALQLRKFGQQEYKHAENKGYFELLSMEKNVEIEVITPEYRHSMSAC